jgi:hypothetical protein
MRVPLFERWPRGYWLEFDEEHRLEAAGRTDAAVCAPSRTADMAH